MTKLNATHFNQKTGSAPLSRLYAKIFQGSLHQSIPF